MKFIVNTDAIPQRLIDAMFLEFYTNDKDAIKAYNLVLTETEEVQNAVDAMIYICDGMENFIQTVTCPVKDRLAIVQESGNQLGPSNGYEGHINSFVPFDDAEFGKQYSAELNAKADLPFYLASVEVRVLGGMQKYDYARLDREGIERLPSHK